MQKQIGEGSFGKVYLAKWRETTVAVKVLSNSSSSDSDGSLYNSVPTHLLDSLEKARFPFYLCATVNIIS